MARLLLINVWWRFSLAALLFLIDGNSDLIGSGEIAKSFAKWKFSGI